MKWLGLILPAVLLYVAAAFFLSFSNGSASNARAGGAETYVAQRGTAGSLDGLPYRSVTMQIQRPDFIEKYKKCIDEIASVGADTVSFVVDSRQENGTSSHIYLDMRMTPEPDKLIELIKYAKSKDLRVILMPIVLLDAPRGDEWRGTIKPGDDPDRPGSGWRDWWESYRNMLNHFSWIAQSSGADVLVVGSELVSTEGDDQLKEWRKTIDTVRRTFKGKLTYSSNWDHYDHVKFWDQLDMIGMNSYWKMTTGGKVGKAVTLEEIKNQWKEIQGDLLPFIREQGKPLLFLEIGWFSQENVAKEPWNYTKSEVDIDLQLQKRLYDGFFESWYGNPLLGGFSIWEWSPDAGGPDDRGYTPKGKPAEDVLKEWLAKPRWQVRMN